VEEIRHALKAFIPRAWYDNFAAMIANTGLCGFCGGYDHQQAECTIFRICTYCNKDSPRHTVKTCPYMHQFCYSCKKSGHRAIKGQPCPDLRAKWEANKRRGIFTTASSFRYDNCPHHIKNEALAIFAEDYEEYLKDLPQLASFAIVRNWDNNGVEIKKHKAKPTNTGANNIPLGNPNPHRINLGPNYPISAVDEVNPEDTTEGEAYSEGEDYADDDNEYDPEKETKKIVARQRALYGEQHRAEPAPFPRKRNSVNVPDDFEFPDNPREAYYLINKRLCRIEVEHRDMACNPDTRLAQENAELNNRVAYLESLLTKAQARGRSTSRRGRNNSNNGYAAAAAKPRQQSQPARNNPNAHVYNPRASAAAPNNAPAASASSNGPDYFTLPPTKSTNKGKTQRH
jgi:hypothetical protein